MIALVMLRYTGMAVKSAPVTPTEIRLFLSLRNVRSVLLVNSLTPITMDVSSVLLGLVR